MRSVSYYKIENGKRVEASNVNKELAETAYKEFVNKNIRNFDLRVEFGTTTLTTSDIASIKISSDLFSGDTFEIGSVVSETLDMTILNTKSVEIGEKTPIIPFISLCTEVEIVTEIGVEIQEIWQEVCMGIFYIIPDGVTDDGLNTVTIRAASLFGSVAYGDRVFEISDPNSTFERDLDNIIRIIFTDINKSISPNIELKNTDLPTDITIADDSGNIVGKTYGEIIKYIAALYGGYARTIYDEETNDFYLEFFRLPPEQSGYFYDKSNYMSFKRSKDYLRIWKIVCKRGEDDTVWASTTSSGTGEENLVDTGYHTVYMECADMTEERLAEIFTHYEEYSYHPITSKIFGNPVLEVGDRILIRGRDTQAAGAEMPLHSITYNITGSGLTMDIKSIFKTTSITQKKSVKSTIGSMNDDLQKTKEDLTSDINDIKNEITITPEGSEEPVSLKQDYLKTKESLSNSIQTLEKELDDHIKNTADDDSNSGGDIFNDGDKIEFTDSSGKTISSIGSSVWYHDDTVWGPKPSRSLTQFVCEKGSDIAFGIKDSTYESGHNLPLTITSEDVKIDGVCYYEGVNIYDPVISDTVKFASSLSVMEETSGTTKHRLGWGQIEPVWGGDLDFGIKLSGRYRLGLGLHVGKGSIAYDLLTFKGEYVENDNNIYTIEMGADLYANTYTIYGGNPLDSSEYFTICRAKFVDCDLSGLETSVAAQSDYTANLIANGTNENKTYINMSYDSGELRWCWKETVFTYPEADIDPETDEWVYTGRNICYIELPIFMAENIEDNYHINISKMDWGDYRIIEKNPYYFILESQEEDFAFTFEVVAKLKDNDNKSSTEEPIIIEEEENQG